MMTKFRVPFIGYLSVVGLGAWNVLHSLLWLEYFPEPTAFGAYLVAFVVLMLVGLLFTGVLAVAAYDEYIEARIPNFRLFNKQAILVRKLEKAQALRAETSRVIEGLPEDSVHRSNLQSRMEALKATEEELKVEMVYGKLSKLDKKISKVIK